MTLTEKIKLVDDLIREDKETTIRQYLDAIAEIDNIKPPEVNKPKNYTTDQAQFMLTHHKQYTCVEMAEKLEIEPADVYNFAYRNKLSFKRQDKKMPYVRPPAQYSNHSPFGIAS